MNTPPLKCCEKCRCWNYRVKGDHTCDNLACSCHTPAGEAIKENQRLMNNGIVFTTSTLSTCCEKCKVRGGGSGGGSPSCYNSSCPCHTDNTTGWEERAVHVLRAAGIEMIRTCSTDDQIPAIISFIRHEIATAYQDRANLIETAYEKGVKKGREEVAAIAGGLKHHGNLRGSDIAFNAGLSAVVEAARTAKEGESNK